MDDGEAVRLALQGNAAAMSELAQGWSARVFAFCLARCRNRHVAEDLAQEALLRAIRSLASLECPERFGPWLRGIAIRVFLDWKKARQTSQVPFSTLDSDETVAMLLAREPDSSVERDDESSWLLREVDSLDEELRETLLLYYAGEMTYAQLAQILEVSPATVNFRLTKARTILRNRMTTAARGDR